MARTFRTRGGPGKKATQQERAVELVRSVLHEQDVFTAEELVKRLELPMAAVQRALLHLRTQPGWSISESNDVAYGRRRMAGIHTANNRWRKKPKTSADFDPHEPEWQPTYYRVEKRPEVTHG
jgi:hypothetical protein